MMTPLIKEIVEREIDVIGMVKATKQRYSKHGLYAVLNRGIFRINGMRWDIEVFLKIPF
ncbi:hypothetical protein ACH0B6_09665 [Solibacillus silvestris]